MLSITYDYNSFSADEEKKDYKGAYVTESTWRKFRGLAGEKGLTTETCLQYLLQLAEQDKIQKIGDIVNVSVAKR